MKAIHFAGGVRTKRTDWLRGWACCCSGRKCMTIPWDRLTVVADRVTCERCKSTMRKDVNASTRFPTL